MWHSLPHDQRCNYVGYQWFCRRNFSRSYRADQPAYIASHFLEFRSAWGTKLDLDSAQLEEAKEFLSAAERASGKIGICFQNRYNVPSQTLAALLDTGELGTPPGHRGGKL